jgi:nitrogen fixation protein NifQ
MMNYRQSMEASQDTEVFEDIFALLWQYRRDDKADTEIVAHFLVAGCAGENHLWEDMGLPDRETLSRLIRHYFPALFHKNKANMRWKKFFYKQLCDRVESRVCKAPSCGECIDYASCFGPG